MNQRYLQTVYESEEDWQLARILSMLIFASLGTYLFVVFTGLYYGDWKLIAVTMAGCALQILPLALIRRGYLRASSMIVVLSTLGTVTFIATVGQGIRDLAIVAFPIVLIFAGLTLNHALFRLCVGLTLAAVCWLVIGEINRWFVTKPFDGVVANWIYLIVTILILLVAALAVDLLATNMRKSLELARHEISQRKLAEEALREKEVQYRNLADSGIALIWRSGTDKLCNYFNLPWLKFTGRTLEQELGNGWAEGVHPDDRNRCLETYITAFDKREAFDMEYRVRDVSGKYRWLRDLGVPNYNSAGEFIGYIGHCFDITDLKLTEEQLRYQGTHDVLTGIYNRAFFETELTRLEHSREFPASIIMADVDMLKAANDIWGHTTGDDLLCRAANLLRSVFREGDVLARIGGDEFAALLPNTNAATAEQIMSRVRQQLAKHNAKHLTLPVQLSLGTATAEKNNLTNAFMLADKRMYADKAAHKSSANPTPAS